MGGIPQNYTVDVNLDLVTPVELAGIPTNYHLDIGSLPKIQIGIDPITINPITVNPLTLNPLDISVRVKEAPSIRAHVQPLLPLFRWKVTAGATGHVPIPYGQVAPQ